MATITRKKTGNSGTFLGKAWAESRLDSAAMHLEAFYKYGKDLEMPADILGRAMRLEKEIKDLLKETNQLEEIIDLSV